MGYWGVPRGTVDVDVTVFLPPERPTECLDLLRRVGCEFSAAMSAESVSEHGLCRVTFAGLVVNVFFPMVPFYEAAAPGGGGSNCSVSQSWSGMRNR